MQLAPRYGTDPIITLDGTPGEVLAPVVGQRRRLVEVLGGFDEEHWAGPSRCAGWSNRDVIVHLDSTNAFWSYSIASIVPSSARPVTLRPSPTWSTAWWCCDQPVGRVVPMASAVRESGSSCTSCTSRPRDECGGATMPPTRRSWTSCMRLYQATSPRA